MGALLLGFHNEFKNDQALTAGTWQSGQLTISDATADVTAPDGTSTASRLLETAVNAAHFFQPNPAPVSVFAGQTWQVSCFVRGGGTLSSTRRILTLWNDGTGVNYCIFNPRTNLVDVANSANVRGEIIAVANGWSRFTCFYSNVPAGQEANASGILFELDNGADGTGASPVYVGTTTAGLYVWRPTLAPGGEGPVDTTVTTGAAITGSARGLVR